MSKWLHCALVHCTSTFQRTRYELILQFKQKMAIALHEMVQWKLGTNITNTFRNKFTLLWFALKCIQPSCIEIWNVSHVAPQMGRFSRWEGAYRCKEICSSFSHVMMCSVQSSLKLGVVSGVSIRSDICDVLCYVHDIGLCSIDHPHTCSVELLLKRQGHWKQRFILVWFRYNKSCSRYFEQRESVSSTCVMPFCT